MKFYRVFEIFQRLIKLTISDTQVYPVAVDCTTGHIAVVWPQEEEYLVGSENIAYERKRIKRKRLEHYGENIIISNEKRNSDKVTLRETALEILESYLLRQFDIRFSWCFPLSDFV